MHLPGKERDRAQTPPKRPFLPPFKGHGAGAGGEPYANLCRALGSTSAAKPLATRVSPSPQAARDATARAALTWSVLPPLPPAPPLPRGPAPFPAPAPPRALRPRLPPSLPPARPRAAPATWRSRLDDGSSFPSVTNRHRTCRCTAPRRLMAPAARSRRRPSAQRPAPSRSCACAAPRPPCATATGVRRRPPGRSPATHLCAGDGGPGRGRLSPAARSQAVAPPLSAAQPGRGPGAAPLSTAAAALAWQPFLRLALLLSGVPHARAWGMDALSPGCGDLSGPGFAPVRTAASCWYPGSLPRWTALEAGLA